MVEKATHEELMHQCYLIDTVPPTAQHEGRLLSESSQLI